MGSGVTGIYIIITNLTYNTRSHKVIIALVVFCQNSCWMEIEGVRPASGYLLLMMMMMTELIRFWWGSSLLWILSH